MPVTVTPLIWLSAPAPPVSMVVSSTICGFMTKLALPDPCMFMISMPSMAHLRPVLPWKEELAAAVLWTAPSPPTSCTPLRPGTRTVNDARLVWPVGRAVR